MRKITMVLPADLLADAQKATGEGVTETVRRALKAVLHSSWSQRMAALEGRASLKLDLDRLRDDGDAPARDAAA